MPPRAEVKPILTNPIPTPINPVAALKKLLMGSFARFYKKKTKKLADKLHNRVNKKIKTATLADGGGGLPPKKGGNKPLKELDPITPQPPFKKNKKHDAKEFRKQLDMQEDGLNKMSVKDYLDNRESLKQMNPAQKKAYNTASQKARSKYRNDKIDEMARNIKRSNPKISKAEAKKRATSYLKGKDALHEVDAIAGGNNNVVRMGDRGVNRSLGSQWTKKGIADNIELQVRDQIRQMGYIVPPTTNLPSNLMMNVRL